MTTFNSKIGFGGGCHWCTEAVFQSLKGVDQVEQGYASSIQENNSFSEAVIVHFDAEKIPLEILIQIHLKTHQSTSEHSMRDKYRSAIYTFSEHQAKESKAILNNLLKKSNQKIITQVLAFHQFQPSREAIADYYYKNPEKPFCESFIKPKLKLLLEQFSSYGNSEKLSHLKSETAEYQQK